MFGQMNATRSCFFMPALRSRGRQAVHTLLELPVRVVPGAVDDGRLVREDVGVALEEAQRRELGPVHIAMLHCRASGWGFGVCPAVRMSGARSSLVERRGLSIRQAEAAPALRGASSWGKIIGPRRTPRLPRRDPACESAWPPSSRIPAGPAATSTSTGTISGSPISAEPLGFDSVWGVEHHFTDYTMCPDVLAVPDLHGGADHARRAGLHGRGAAVARPDARGRRRSRCSTTSPAAG